MLVIRDVSKTYENGVHALRGVSLDVPAGMFGLWGRTAPASHADEHDRDPAGVRPRHHHARWAGRASRAAGSAQAAGLPATGVRVYPRVSAEALLHHLAVLKGIAERGERRDAVERLLRLTNLWEVRTRRLSGFSGGMRQRFGIAQALWAIPNSSSSTSPRRGSIQRSASASSISSARSVRRSS